MDLPDGTGYAEYGTTGTFFIRNTAEDDALTIYRYSSTGGPWVNLRRSDVDTLGGAGTVDSGDNLGNISFGGSAPSFYLDGAWIRSYASENWTDTSSAADLRFVTTPTGSTSPVERMRISSTGLITAGAGSGESLGAWQSYAATIGGTGWAIGDGTITTSYMQIGKLVIYKYSIVFGSTSTYGSASLTLTLPLTMGGSITTGQGMNNTTLFDTSASARYAANSRRNSNTVISFGTLGTNGLLGSTISTSPFTWAVGDSVYGMFIYETA